MQPACRSACLQCKLRWTYDLQTVGWWVDGEVQNPRKMQRIENSTATKNTIAALLTDLTPTYTMPTNGMEGR